MSRNSYPPPRTSAPTSASAVHGRTPSASTPPRKEPPTGGSGRIHYDLVQDEMQKATIRVIGVGGGGGNAVNNMIESGMTGVDFIAVNTDAQDLERSLAPRRFQLGGALTKGLGAGANPEIGREAALEDRDRLAELVAERMEHQAALLIGVAVEEYIGVRVAPRHDRAGVARLNLGEIAVTDRHQATGEVVVALEGLHTEELEVGRERLVQP